MMKRQPCKPWGRAMLIVAGWAIALPLSAQVPPGRSEPVPPEIAPPVPADSAQIEEQKIDQFAQAYIAVEEIHTRATRELDTVEDPEVASRLKADAESRIIQAVERSGLKLDEFNQIAERMASDRDLRLRIADKVRELRRI